MNTKFIIKSPDVKQNCLREIQGLPFGQYEVVIQRKKRSNGQNALYWKRLEVIGNVLGYSKDEMHEEFASRFLGLVERTTISGRTIVEPVSTTGLSTKDFSEYMTMIEAFAAQQDITLPSNEYYGLE